MVKRRSLTRLESEITARWPIPSRHSLIPFNRENSNYIAGLFGTLADCDNRAPIIPPIFPLFDSRFLAVEDGIFLKKKKKSKSFRFLVKFGTILEIIPSVSRVDGFLLERRLLRRRKSTVAAQFSLHGIFPPLFPRDASPKSPNHELCRSRRRRLFAHHA